MIDKIRPKAIARLEYNDDGKDSRYVIRYYCPRCNRDIAGYKSDTACDYCGTFYDWGKHAPQIKVTRTVEW